MTRKRKKTPPIAPRAPRARRATSAPASEARSQQKQRTRRPRVTSETPAGDPSTGSKLPETGPSEDPRSDAAASNTPADERQARTPLTSSLPPQGAEPAPLGFVEPSLSSGSDESNDLDEEAPELGIGSRVVAPNVRFDPEASAPTPLRPARFESRSSADLEAQIQALEARLDGLIRRAVLPLDESPALALRDRIGEAALEVVERISQPPAVVDGEAEGDADPATTDYVARRWGRQALRSRFEEVDDFGLDPGLEQRVRPALDLLYRRYFRVQVEGIEHVPMQGRAVIVANHSGTLPIDGAMLRAAMRLDHPGARDLRWLAEDFVFHLPFAGVLLNRIGAVRACPENAERLLEKDALVAVFPEGVHGIKKLFSERYRLQRFGRGGFIRLCLRTRAPLIPCAIIGAEETNPMMYRLESLARLLNLPYLPVTPTFPLLGPLGLLPAPTRWKLKFGEPIAFEPYGPEAAEDHLLVGRLAERVRNGIQTLLDSGLRERKSVWFG
ncbi:MAG TPA: lysophospholipid acyltransferase family protein [Polyangiaceae bacterium]|nr:lysophospholipid acyltransferase family protein [Polyangiaceae bacterium]